MHLEDEFAERDGSELGRLGIEVGDGVENVVVGLEEQAVRGAGNEGLRRVVQAETEVEAVGKELEELPGMAPIAVPDDGLTGTELATNEENIVDGADAVEQEWQAELFAQGYFLAEDSKLQIVGCGAEFVESAFAYGEEVLPHPFRGGEVFFQMPGVAASGVDAVLDDALTIQTGMVAVEIYVIVRC